MYTIICTRMFIAIYFGIVKNWKRLNYHNGLFQVYMCVTCVQTMKCYVYVSCILPRWKCLISFNSLSADLSAISMLTITSLTNNAVFTLRIALAKISENFWRIFVAARVFSCCGEQGLLFIARASHCCGFSSCRARALACGLQ